MPGTSDDGSLEGAAMLVMQSTLALLTPAVKPSYSGTPIALLRMPAIWTQEEEAARLKARLDAFKEAGGKFT